MTSAAARLIDTPQAPVPAGGAAELFQGAGGVPLRAAIWRPQGEVAGSVILSPGRTEPIEKYFEVVGELLSRGFVVLAHDWRGQGLSHRLLADRMRGHAEDWRHFVADYKAMLAAFEDRLPPPRIALSHSMGGCFVALSLPAQQGIDAAIFTGPMFGVHVSKLPVWLSHGVAQAFCVAGQRMSVVPRGSYDPLTARFDPGNILTHDRDRFERHQAQLKACPELALGGVTWGWLDQAYRAMARAKSPANAGAIHIPMVLLVGAEERLVVNAETRLFAARAPDAKVVEVAGARHEILMETDSVRAVFWAEFDALAARVRQSA